MKKLELQKCIVGSVYTNCYFLKNKETGELLIVDPGDAADMIERKVSEMQGKPVGILLTHGHFDHIMAADEVRKKYNIPIYASEKEETTLLNPKVNLSVFGHGSCTLDADVYLKDLQVVELAGFSVQMIETPGHTVGSCCYYLKEEGVLFSGDTVFQGSVGRTDFPEGSTVAIVRSLHRLLDTLPDETEVYPGHDASTTIGYEKRYNIDILFLDKEFEHDIYELIRAFYPESEITSSYEEKGADCDLYFRIEKQDNSCMIYYEDNENKGVTSAEFVEGQSSDALVSCTDAQGSDTKERAHAIRKERKDIVKIALYKLLVKITGKTLPWGNLTGIRPAKLAMGLIESGMKNTEAAQEMRNRYMVSPEKTALAITIANREREILKDIDYENGYSLYVGIPFCPSICLYCSFSSYPLKQWKDRVDLYLEALCKEIKAVSEIMKQKGKKLDTVYIGGGTPTTLEAEQLKVLFDALMENFDCHNLAEFTIEAGRPDSITREKLMMIRNYPVTRISVNPQTMNQETLDIIGRRHTVQETEQAFLLARECGFDNINMDLIVGLPGEDREMVRHTLDEVRRLEPDSMTVHSLAVKRAARLNMFKDKYQEMTFENNQEIMDMTMRAAYEMEMGPYYLYRQKNMKGNFENVGYAKVDKAGIYNILIMEEKQPIIALGAGGSSKLVFDHGKRIERVENVKDVTNYISRIDEMIERKRTGIQTWL